MCPSPDSDHRNVWLPLCSICKTAGAVFAVSEGGHTGFRAFVTCMRCFQDRALIWEHHFIHAHVTTLDSEEKAS